MRMRVPRSASICLLALGLTLATANESNAQRLTPAMLCSWAHLHAPGASVNAQSQFAPYYGKNQIHYDKFEWFIYKTDHFEIYYYPEHEQHLARVASYAESAYQHVSSDLRHDLAQRVPLIIFKTHSEFQQQNIAPGAAQEGVLAFAEGERHRMVLPIDLPSDLLYGLIVHELTHVFQYDIIPTSLIRRNMPLWVHEGGAEYERGIWDPLDLMTVRDAAVADIIPRMSQMEGYGDFGSPRLVYNLGHALYEFIEARWNKDGVRQFLFSLRKSAIGGGSSPYEEAFQMSAREFDQQFEKYLKDRFKAFRDKERPADYGQDLSPDPERSDYTGAISIEPSPSGDLIAMATGNRRDQELDIILVSAKDGAVVRNLTPGFDMDRGFEYLAYPSLSSMVSWMSWSPVGDRLAYFVRQEKYKTLIIQNVLTGKIENRINIQSVDNPESPNISPDGRTVLFSGLRGAIGDLFRLDIASGDITNLTNDEFADYGPTYSADGSFIVYLARISGSQKLFRLDVATGKKTQLTFGTQDEAAAKFLNADTLLFSSTATDPATPLTPEVARNGNIFNLWTLSLKTGELRQYTDALGGVLSPVVLSKDATTPKLAFVDYYKGSFSLHTFDLKEPLHTAASADFGTPGPIVDFQAPLQHTLVAENKSKKGRFDKMFLDGRPPVNVGVTSGGDVFGGSMVSFTDVLGDQQFSMYASSVQQVQDAVVLVRQPVAALPVRAAGLLADAVLLRAAGAVLLRSADRAVHQTRRRTRHADGARRLDVRHLPVQHLSANRAIGRRRAFRRRIRGSAAADRGGSVSAGTVRNPAVQSRHDGATRRVVHPGDDGVPRVRAAVGQHDAPVVRGCAQGGQLAVAPDGRRRCALLRAARGERGVRGACLRLQELGQRAGLHVLRRQLRNAWVRLPAVPRP